MQGRLSLRLLICRCLKGREREGGITIATCESERKAIRPQVAGLLTIQGRCGGERTPWQIIAIEVCARVCVESLLASSTAHPCPTSHICSSSICNAGLSDSTSHRQIWLKSAKSSSIDSKEDCCIAELSKLAARQGSDMMTQLHHMACTPSAVTEIRSTFCL